MNSTFYTTEIVRIYGPERAIAVERRINALIEKYRGRVSAPADPSLSERDAVLITYGDQIRQAGELPLQTLAEFSEQHLRGVVSAIHILPFYPWSSDDGFSVKDYRVVDPTLGTWQEVEQIGRSFRLMFDGVINHMSAQSEWFQAFLRDEAPYRNYFLTVEGSPDLSYVVRPRALPLLTTYETVKGPRRVWTTFSADQVDLDYHNPDVLIDIFDILLLYAQRGAQFLRLDAIAYLWKNISTSCIHLPETHAVIRLLRCVLDEVAPHVRLITETNVPHQDNISYFGDGADEAQLVYNFALPPLVAHTLRVGDASVLSKWGSTLDLPSDQTTFFNFLASHDGIGLNPARGILSPAEIDGLIEQAQAHGGRISYKQNPDGTQSAYEINISYFDMLSNPFGSEPLAIQAKRFMAAQAIMLALRGMPGVYFHSLFGSRNWNEGVQLTQHNRTINRQKLERTALEADLNTAQSLRLLVFQRYRELLQRRAAHAAFHPNGGQEILNMGPGVFAILRSSRDNQQQMLCLQNVTAQSQLAGGRSLEPYQTLWIELLP